ncbi:hypothetical protein [Paenibacillus ferrarius]|uniref:hypothetical protein n=1 Tax=Paenibacillus ferrarius TaxID=1469647 RepID=UPI003D2C9884
MKSKINGSAAFYPEIAIQSFDSQLPVPQLENLPFILTFSPFGEAELENLQLISPKNRLSPKIGGIDWRNSSSNGQFGAKPGIKPEEFQFNSSPCRAPRTKISHN